jgi:PAS domain S-box-containing protein
MNLDSKKSTRWAVLALLVIALLATFTAWRYAKQNVEAQANDRFQFRIQQTKAAIYDRMLAYEHVLRGGVGLFASSGNKVDQATWQTYTATLNINENYPGIQGLGFSRRIWPAELASHVAEIRKQGHPDYAIRPAGERAEYTSIIFIEPFDQRNLRAFGFDMFSEPTRRAAMEWARDSGKTSVSGKVKLVQEAGKDLHQAGFLMYLPVYRGPSPQNAAQRRAALLGYVYGPFRMNDLMQGVLGKSTADIALQIFDDAGITESTLMYNSHPEHAKEASLYSDMQEIEINGRVWTLHFSSLPLFESAVNRVTPVVVAASGLLLTLLITLLLWSVFSTRARAQAMANTMTANLLEQKERLRSVIDTALDAIIVISDSGIMESCNAATHSIFGYKPEELAGRNVSMLMPEPYHSQHDGYLQRFLQTGAAHVIGIGREVVGLRKDGSTFPMELSVGEMHSGNQRKFTGMVRDITERKKVDRLKSEFVSTVSHELRTPLTSIRGSLGLVLGGVTGELPAQSKSLLDIAYKNTERLVRLINDILDIEKIESGKMSFEMKPQNLMPIIEQAIETSRAYGDQYGVTFELVATLPEAKVNIDHDRLTQVMANLLSNAAKFSPRNGRVEISVTPSQGKFRVSVSDHGEGIPDAFHSKIFQKFSQADGSDTRKKGGTGLGLSITKAMIEIMGGSMGFDSQAGVGSCFYFELPECCEDSTDALSDTPKNIIASNLPRVLVCEDDRDIAKLLSMMLKAGGFDADIAYDAAQAKTMLQQRHYAAMTVDLGLPGQNGMSLIRELREHAETLNLPIVVVSAMAAEGSAEANGNFAVLDWLGKPIDQTRLITQLESVIKKVQKL